MKLLTTALSVAAAAMLAAPGVQADDHADAAKTEGQIKLEKMLEGRVAGEPRSCLYMRPHVDLTVIDETALVYKSGSTLWVNIPRNAEDVDEDDTLVSRRSSPNLCRTDIVTTQDRFNGFFTGSIQLGDFVPYRRVES